MVQIHYGVEQCVSRHHSAAGLGFRRKDRKPDKGRRHSALRVHATTGGEGYVPVMHPILALTAFVSGGVAAIMAYKVAAAPFRYISIVLGVITLVSVVLGFVFLDKWQFVEALGEGGTERWIAYPVVLWLTMFGGYLMGHSRREPSDA